MKVLHLINTLSAGGAELHLLTLCKHLKKLGAQLTVACLREKVRDSKPLRPDFEAAGIKVFSLGGEGRWSPGYLARSLALIRREGPDILHTHLPRADFAGLVAHMLGPSFSWVSSVHGLYGGWSGRWALPLFGYVWRRPNVVIAISQAVKDWLVDTRGVPAGKVKVVYYGIDFERFYAPRADLRRSWGLNGNLVIGSIGRLEPVKSHETLVRAMPAVLEKAPNTRLLIAGHDPYGYREKLEGLIRRLGLEEQVRLVGFQEDIPSFLHSIDVFALASRSEGFGQVLIEAMSAGKAVVATDIAPVNEIVAGDRTGLLSEPYPEAFAGALLELLTDPEEMARMGEQGTQRVRELFAAERMAEETMDVYRALLEGSA